MPILSYRALAQRLELPVQRPALHTNALRRPCAIAPRRFEDALDVPPFDFLERQSQFILSERRATCPHVLGEVSDVDDRSV